MLKLTVYTKLGCWFCEKVEEMLKGLEEKRDLDLTRIDITEDDDLYDEYRYDVPAIEFPDGSYLYRRITKKDLLDKLDEYTK